MEFPDRYHLAKVAGTDDIYDLTPAPGEVTEMGMPINKANLFSDDLLPKYFANPTGEETPRDAFANLFSKRETLTPETAALYGLEEDAAPEDVFVKARSLITTAQNTANGRAQIATGSYVGTGTYGSADPCSLTFSFVPRIVLIAANSPGKSIGCGICFMPGIQTASGGFDLLGPSWNAHITIQLDGRKMTWYSNPNYSADSYGPGCQMNESGTTYTYTAFG